VDQSALPVSPNDLCARLGTASAPVAEEKFQRLTGAQIRATFAGMEMMDNVHRRDVYEASGTLTSYSMGRKRNGKSGRTSFVSTLRRTLRQVVTKCVSREKH
jgi:hypothetical protein